MKNKEIKKILRLLLIAIATIISFILLLAIISLFKKNYDNAEKTNNISESYNMDLPANFLFEGVNLDEEMGDYEICFKGRIDKFSSISIGKDYSIGSKVTIDNEYISLYLNNELKDQYDNNLIIDKNIYISVVTDLNNRAVITISSNGKNMVIEDVNWSARTGKIFAESGEETILHNCSLTYNCYGWNKPIWLMGDSYFNCTSSARWTSYLIKQGNDNYLLNGYSGRNSDAALESLQVMLQYGKPKEIIWCLGMNDGDSENAINEAYYKDVEELKKLCKDNNIELILSTVPSCPMVNNDYKNQYVKESGYKYIDFAKAVGSYEDINWYPGMLEEKDEPIHPTNEGAVALYNEAVATCPELLY